MYLRGVLLMLMVGVVWAQTKPQTAPSCPKPIEVPKASGEGLWYLQYATPLYQPVPCSPYNTVPNCKCQKTNVTKALESGKVVYTLKHSGLNIKANKTEGLSMKATQKTSKIFDFNVVVEINVKRGQSVIVGTDNFQSWATVSSCVPLPDPTGKNIQAHWILTKKKDPTDDVLKAALAKIPKTAKVTRTSQADCPL